MSTLSRKSERSVPPPLHSSIAELAVVGGSLVYPEAIHKAREIVSAQMFFEDPHRRCFAAMLRMIDRGEPVDVITLSEELKRVGDFDPVGGAPFLSELLDVASAVNIEHHARIVREKAALRRTAEEAEKLSEAIRSGATLGAIQSQITAVQEATATGRKDRAPVVGPRSLAEILSDPAALEPPVVVVPRLAWRGRVSLLAAREKAGKSTTAGAVAAAVSRGTRWLGDNTLRGPVLLIALEEHVGDVAIRMQEWGADPALIYVVDSLATMSDPLRGIRTAVDEVRPALVIVDTLAALVDCLHTRPDPGSSTAWTPIMAALTRIARDSDAALLLLHHSRKSDGAYRDSSAIGAGVDAIMEMSEDGQDADVRKIKVRARWKVGDYTIRQVGTRYELSSGEMSLDTRVLLRIQAHPGCSVRKVREGVSGKAEEVGAAIKRLIGRGAAVDLGDGAGMKLYPADTGNHSGNHPGSAEKPQGTATEPLSGTTPVPFSKSLGEDREPPLNDTIFDAPEVWDL